MSRCLLLLLQKHGDVVSQREFFAEVWERHGQCVTANTFYQNISILRKSLKAAGLEGNVIKTVPKLGIQFIGDIEDVTPEISQEDRPLAMSKDEGDEQLPNPQGIRRTRKNETRVVAITALALFLTFSLVLFGNMHKNSVFFADYLQIGKINTCTVYAKGLRTGGQKTHALSLITNINLQCQSNQAVYFAENANNTRASVIVCDGKIQGSSLCMTNYYIEQDDEKFN